MLLYLYELMSGIKINFAKSEIWIINGDNEVGQIYVDIFNCQVGVFLIKYLGVTSKSF